MELIGNRRITVLQMKDSNSFMYWIVKFWVFLYVNVWQLLFLVTDSVLQLDTVIAITANISNGTAALTAAMTSSGTSLLTAIEKTVQQFNLPTIFNSTDSCALNGKCISGLQYSACICISNYYGPACTLSKSRFLFERFKVC